MPPWAAWRDGGPAGAVGRAPWLSRVARDAGRRIQLVGGPAAGPSPWSGHGETPLDGVESPVRARGRVDLDPATKRLLIGLAGVLVLGALVLGAVALRSLTKGKPDAPAGTAANPRPAAVDTVEQVVGQLEDFVERARGASSSSHR